MKTIAHCAIILALATVGAACQTEKKDRGGGGGGDDTPAGGDLTGVTYEKDISAFLTKWCVSCHTGDSPSGDVNLSTYEGAKAAATKSLKQMQGGDMPPKDKPQPAKAGIDKFAAWVKAKTPKGTTSQLPAQQGAKITWDNWTNQFFQKSCVSCHNPQNKGGGVDLSTYETAKGKAQASYDAMKSGKMPKKTGGGAATKVSDDVLKKMENWITNKTLKTDTTQSGTNTQGAALNWNGGMKQWFAQTCGNSSCHNSQDKAGGYDLSSQTAVQKAQGGIINSITGNRMPKGNTPLPAAELTKLQNWFNAGAP